MSSLFPVKVNEKQFLSDVEKCKRFIDAGINEKYFILWDASSFCDVTEIGATLLKDIDSFFGDGYISLFRFVVEFPPYNGSDDVCSFRIRKPTKQDMRNFRGVLRYLPTNTWIADWSNAKGGYFAWPFMQKDSGEITCLFDIPSLRADRVKTDRSMLTQVDVAMPHIIERLPDMVDCLMAGLDYKGIRFYVPIAKGTAKYTFKNRERENEVKTRLIHEVKSHERKNLKNTDEVRYHLRGTSDFAFHGLSVTLVASVDMSAKASLSEQNDVRKKKRR